MKNKCNFYSQVGKNVSSGMEIKKSFTKIKHENRAGFRWLKIVKAQRRQAGVCALGICVEVKVHDCAEYWKDRPCQEDSL